MVSELLRPIGIMYCSIYIHCILPESVLMCFILFLRYTGGSSVNVFLSNTSTKETEKIVSSLQSKNYFVNDEISMNVLKISPPFINSSLNYIYNKSISTGIALSHLKYSILKPLFKICDKSNIANKRPVSLLTLFSKVLGTVMYKKILTYINNYNNFNWGQNYSRKRLLIIQFVKY